MMVFPTYSWGQQDYRVQLNQSHFLPEADIHKFQIDEEQWEKSVYQDKLYALIQFEQIPSRKALETLERHEIKLLDYVPNYAYYASFPKSLKIQTLSQLKIRSIRPIQAAWKIAPALELENFPTAIDNKLELQISLQKDIDKKSISATIKDFGKILRPRYTIETEQILYLQIPASQEAVRKLAALPFIQYIQPKASTPQSLTTETSAAQRTNYIGSTNIGALGLSGDGVVVGVGDAGTIDEHIDLENRILNANIIDENLHGAKVTGIIAGEGILNPSMHGLAPGTNIVAETFTNVINSIGQYYTNLGMILTNNSYGTNMQPFCTNIGAYNGSSKAMDQIANNYPEVLHCLAAGNDGNESCSPYPAGFGTVFQGLQSSKNGITIGSVDAFDDIAYDSSRGPTKDGRVKPDIVGVGVDVQSPTLNNQYSIGSGTSFSTPAITATFALLWEHYRNENNGNNPTAALMKAIACNTADDLGNPGPDFTYGYGRINARRAAQVISDDSYLENTISHNSIDTEMITIPANTAELRVLLYWQDKDGNPAASTSLVHNLDLMVTAPDNSNYQPWVLDPSGTNVQNNAVRAVDNLNNIEQVTIDAPAAGTYTLSVIGESIVYGTQRYNLIYEIVPEHVQLTYPIGGESFSPGETMHITWDAAGYETESFTLAYSLNNGLSWTNIDTNVPGTERQYNFTVPSVVSTNALLRVIRNNSPLASGSNTTFHILGVPSNFNVSPDCDGNMQLTWDAVSGVPSYRVYEFQGGNWITIGNATGNSFSVSGRTPGQTYCYNIRSNFGGGLMSRFAFGQCATAFGQDVNGLPYFEDFEATNGNWTAAGKNADWAWGTPSNTIINSAASGTKAWVTNLSGSYANASQAYLYSPCFDLSSLTQPQITFSLIYQIEDNAVTPTNAFDMAELQYSTDGKNWTRLGFNGTGQNWYSNTGGLSHWDGEQLTWVTASCNQLPNDSRVQLRFVFDADQYGNEEGIGIDDICISETGSGCAMAMLDLKMILGGNYNNSNSNMRDQLRVDNLISLSEPYTTMGYTHVADGGGETTSTMALSITGNNAIVDWVLIEVRDPNTPSTIISTRAALLQVDGDVVDVDGVSPVSFPSLSAGNYHVAIRHRNHLGTMTQNPIFIGT